MKTSLSVLASPSQWTVRTRTTVAATMVVTLCLMLAGGALLMVLFQSLATSAKSTADGRAAQIVEQLRTEPASDLDRAMLATDAQVGMVQVVDRSGKIIVASAGSPAAPVSSAQIPPGSRTSLGRIALSADNDFWVTGVGTQTPAGPVTVLVGADREPVETVATTVAGLLAIGGPIVVALVAFGTYRLVGAALQPVERIRARVSSVTSGKLDERIPVPAVDDEVGRLAVTMNDMLDRLESGQTAQRRFVSDASHELRSPLSTIIAALELAHGRPEFLDQEVIDESLLPEAHRMRRLVEDLLLLARADEHRDVQVAIDVDLDDIVYAEADRVRAITDLRVATEIRHVRVSGDQRTLSRLVRNLVDNAIRHAHSSIRLECAQVAARAQVVVADDGLGVPVAERRRIFDRFIRLDSPRTRESGGAGLGLSIVAQIADAHHGTVTVGESSSGGARFVVRLPLAVDDTVSDTTNRLDTVTGER
ncbi:signal transduction histidine kinase [Mycobacterium sp. AZCC_0083]|nr:signal transduction histidine kinase [Mycobacterium sp. AZCC_0083]